jgi:hypothetical protein
MQLTGRTALVTGASRGIATQSTAPSAKHTTIRKLGKKKGEHLPWTAHRT